eukprot:364965-Chlamydomonas_euryale.AAC.36
MHMLMLQCDIPVWQRARCIRCPCAGRVPRLSLLLQRERTSACRHATGASAAHSLQERRVAPTPRGKPACGDWPMLTPHPCLPSNCPVLAALWSPADALHAATLTGRCASCTHSLATGRCVSCSRSLVTKRCVSCSRSLMTGGCVSRCRGMHCPLLCFVQLCTKLTLRSTETDPSGCAPVALTNFYDDRRALFDEACDRASVEQQPEAALQPMSPVASALAMLPQASKGLLPQPAQQLMAAGSPLESLFFECQECAALKGRASALSQAVGVCRLQVSAIRDALSEAESAGSDAGAGADNDKPSTQPGSSAEPAAEPAAGTCTVADLSSSLEAAVEAAAEARERAIAARQDYASHVLAAHPYTPFPVTAIVSAVEGLPDDAFSAPELKLMRFSRSTLLAAPGWEPPPGRGERVQPQAPPPPPRRRSKQALPVQMFAIVGPDSGRSAASDVSSGPLPAPLAGVCLTREEDPQLDVYLTRGPDAGSEGMPTMRKSVSASGRGQGRGSGDGRGGRQGRGRGRSDPARGSRGAGRGQGRGKSGTDQGRGKSGTDRGSEPAPKQSALMADAAGGGQQAATGGPTRAELLAGGRPSVLDGSRSGKPGQGRGRSGARQRDPAAPQGHVSIPAGPDAALAGGGSGSGGGRFQRPSWPGPGQGRGKSRGSGRGQARHDSSPGWHEAAAVPACSPAPGAAAAMAGHPLRTGVPAGCGRSCGRRPSARTVRAAARPPVRAVVSRPRVLRRV